MSPRTRTFFEISLIFTLVSLAFSRYIALTNDPNLCVVGESCLKIAQSPMSKVFGIQTSLLGTVWALAVLGLSLIPSSRALEGVKRAMAWGGIAVACGFQVYAWFFLNEFCMWCAIAAIGIVSASRCIVRSGAPLSVEPLKPRMASIALFAFGMLPYLGVSRLASPFRMVQMTDYVAETLEARASGRPLQKCLFYFTDFACPHCHDSLPGALNVARSRGLKLVPVPIVRILARGNAKAAAYYFVASWKGYGENYIVRHPGEGGLREYNDVAEKELSPTKDEIRKADRMLNEDLMLFKMIGATGTPTLALTEGREIRIGALGAFLNSQR